MSILSNENIDNDIDQESLLEDRVRLCQTIRKFRDIDKLKNIKKDYIIHNMDKSKDELIIINEVLDNFIDYLVIYKQ